VRALGDIGQVRIVSESSIGSNLRRIEAITGAATVQRLRNDEEVLSDLATMLATTPDDLTQAMSRKVAEVKALQKEIKSLQQSAAAGRAGDLVDDAVDGVVVARIDGLDRDTMRDMAVVARDTDGIDAVVLAGAGVNGGVVLISAVVPDGRFVAADLIDAAAKTVQGGFGRKGDPPLIIAGGKNIDGIDEALQQVRANAGIDAV
ncbi:MAG: hypothetical protein GXP35_04095, partial [Actinobacteria bacterium]|nr:hypothetical protein [Actinomycetota bacterium]